MNQLHLYLEKLQRRRELTPLLVLSAFSISLLATRILRLGTIQYGFLVWNLILAWIPWLIAKQLEKHYESPFLFTMPKEIASWGQKISFIGLSFLWLLFFPNAPYLISDLIHLTRRASPIAWYDSVMFFSFGMAGLYVGLSSMALMSRMWRLALPKGWHIPLGLGVIWLSGLGIYMGRDLRFNSWELFTNPLDLFNQTLSQIDFHACSMASIYAGLIIASYISLKTIKNE